MYYVYKRYVVLRIQTHDDIRPRGATARVSTSIHNAITIYDIEYCYRILGDNIQVITARTVSLARAKVNCRGCIIQHVYEGLTHLEVSRSSLVAVE